MKLAMIVIATTLLQGALASPAAAGGFTTHRATDAIIVCDRRHHCWWEPGPRYRFNALFAPARALTESGALGVWRPVWVARHHLRRR